MRHTLKLLLTAMGLCSSLAVMAEDEFECHFEISQGQEAIRTITLNTEVYACLHHDNYQDLMVINGNKQVVPLKRLTKKVKADIQRYNETLTFYPEPETTAYSVEQRLRRLTAIPKPESNNTPSLHFNSFILENKSKDSLESLSVELPTNKALSVIVIVEASDNLQNWRSVTEPTQLYFLGNNDSDKLKKQTIHLQHAQTSRYFRMALFSNTANFTQQLTGVSGAYRHVEYDEQALQWISSNELPRLPEKENTQHNTIAFELPGPLPVSQIKLESTVNAILLSGTIYAEQHKNPNDVTNNQGIRQREKQKVKHVIKRALGSYTPEQGPNNQPWRYVTSFNWDNLDKTNNNAIPFNTHHNQYWKVAIHQPQTLTEEQWPTLQFGWQAAEFVFIAEGEGPFYLLAGRDKPATQRSIPSHLLSDDTTFEPVKLKAGTMQFTKKEEPIKDIKNSPAYLRIILWVVMLLGVGLMGLMAYRLFKEMNGSDKK